MEFIIVVGEILITVRLNQHVGFLIRLRVKLDRVVTGVAGGALNRLEHESWRLPHGGLYALPLGDLYDRFRRWRGLYDAELGQILLLIGRVRLLQRGRCAALALVGEHGRVELFRGDGGRLHAVVDGRRLRCRLVAHLLLVQRPEHGASMEASRLVL